MPRRNFDPIYNPITPCWFMKMVTFFSILLDLLNCAVTKDLMHDIEDDEKSEVEGGDLTDEANGDADTRKYLASIRSFGQQLRTQHNDCEHQNPHTLLRELSAASSSICRRLGRLHLRGRGQIWKVGERGGANSRYV